MGPSSCSAGLGRDVVNALTWARQHDVALRVRSGGLSLEGWSNVDNGIVIDVSELKSVHIDTTARTATVGAGLNQLEAVTAPAPIRALRVHIRRMCWTCAPGRSVPSLTCRPYRHR
ncbi:FAD-binding protein [Streptomyces sp. SID1328]|uniref:FAD-binding protein n=1 Tax=Streptomyces sp. SID1328 TaxID=2690250 RepID=UPI0031F7FAD0